jgi:acyl-ACP thioesterase
MSTLLSALLAWLELLSWMGMNKERRMSQVMSMQLAKRTNSTTQLAKDESKEDSLNHDLLLSTKYSLRHPFKLL